MRADGEEGRQSPRLILASASPARAATLRAAGFEPSIMVSNVDETAQLNQALTQNPGLEAAEQVLVLAKAKAKAVAATVGPALVLGCDSMLELAGQVLGKPSGPSEAFDRIKQQAGRQATLHTGHCLINTAPGSAAYPTQVQDTASALVRFGAMTDQEIWAYINTGEPLAVAGAFTIDGFGGPFIESIDGDPHAVVGLSLPMLRHLLGRLGLSVMDLWRPGLGL